MAMVSYESALGPVPDVAEMIKVIGRAAAHLEAAESASTARYGDQDVRIDLGGILGGLGQFGRPNGGGNNNGNRPNNPLGGFLNAIGGLVENSGLQVELQDGQFQVKPGGNNNNNGLPTAGTTTTTTTTQASVIVPEPTDEPRRRNRCVDRNVEYSGEDLPISQNGRRNKVRNWRDCQASCQATSGSCGLNAKRFQTKIVGGRDADKDEWPWLVAMIRPTTSADSTGQFCGGALISDQHVVTAAHCVVPFTKDQITIRVGEYDFKEKEESLSSDFQVESINSHADYSSRTFENDIAIIKLDKPITRNRSVYPICLPTPERDYTNTRANVVGWGTIYFGGPTATKLQEISIRVWDNQQCAANYGKLNRDVTNSMMCAGDDGKDACQGDSGGPLNCLNSNNGRWELCGVVSWGARCAEKDFPGVYTKVTQYLDWIQANAV
eukprot:maker-scaffold927_size80360-snap-gene-0.28 protein:Tk12216 transcript:maker-scaffold927_size80360-snap-gene-0.28-mRNA-1 annotation:"serine proteinase"